MTDRMGGGGSWGQGSWGWTRPGRFDHLLGVSQTWLLVSSPTWNYPSALCLTS